MNFMINTNYFYTFVEFNFSIILFNIFIYLLLTLLIFTIFICFYNINVFSLTQVKNLVYYDFFRMGLLFSFVSLAGMPPFAGFSGKFLMSIVFFFTNSWLFFFLFFLINIFIIYFYLQNVKFLVRKVSSSAMKIPNGKIILNLSVFGIMVFILYFNFLNLFFSFDMITFFNYWSSLLYLG